MTDAELRNQHHGEVAVLDAVRVSLDLGDIAQLFDDPVEHLAAVFRTAQIAASEHHRHLRAPPVFQEATGMGDLGVEVVVADAGPELHLLDLEGLLVALGGLFFFGQLVLRLPPVENFADGGARVGVDLDEVKIVLASHGTSFFDRYDTDLLAIGSDEADRAESNLMVDTDLGFTGTGTMVKSDQELLQ